MEILIFKTDIQTPEVQERLTSALANLPGVYRSTIDLDDIDKVLRIESSRVSCDEIVSLVNQHGFSCEELPD